MPGHPHANEVRIDHDSANAAPWRGIIRYQRSLRTMARIDRYQR
jgi:hypothetical protein